MWNINQDNLDLDFVYSDTDPAIGAEIAELYSYTEEPEFLINRGAFEQLMEDNGFPLKWTDMTAAQQVRTLEFLADGVEMSKKGSRMLAVRAVLYLTQGSFGECSTVQEQEKLARENVFELYAKGFFSLTMQLLLMEIDAALTAPGPRKQPSNLADSADMRTILNLLYTFVEVIRAQGDCDTDEQKKLREQFREEISQPFGETNELFAITLFQMATKFCNGSAPQFPIKKVLLLLWKVLLTSLGGMDTLRELKDKYRKEVGLGPVPDDTIEVTRTMRAASPPASAAEIMEAQNQRKINRPFKRQMIVKQTSVTGEEQDADGSEGNDEVDAQPIDDQNNADAEVRKNNAPEEKMDIGARPASPRPSNAGLPQPSVLATAGVGHSNLPVFSKGLPWCPKVRQRDIDQFFDQTRSKFVGFILPGDRSTTAGLPGPILEGIKVLHQHMYISLSEFQVKREEELMKYPLTMKEDDALSLTSPSEVLYQAMLPALSQYAIALLKILLAAAPTSKAKTESINIMSEILPEEMPMSVMQSRKLGIDVSRHKEIIIKSVSGILLLLLKHYKINHIYQFEYISQQLMFANCIPLILKFFNQNICQYVSAKTTISSIDFPACVIGEQTELTMETLENAMETADAQPYTWRSMVSCINLLRILNKLTKWKHSRIMMLVVFKSAPILKRALKLRHAMLQLYVLKLLKMQAKYLGRQWRKSNMKTMSAIYQKVRHRITDDWAYGNDLDARPWDFQAEEFALQANINRFHYRRYGKSGSGVAQPPPPPQDRSMGSSTGLVDSFTGENDLLRSVDNNFLSVINTDIELTSEFKYNYETWLDREVFQFTIDWDQLLASTNTTDM